MFKLLKFMGLAIGLTLVAIAFGGVKRVDSVQRDRRARWAPNVRQQYSVV